MPEIETTERFEEAYSKLPLEIRKKVIKALLLLSADPRHPSLQTKPVRGAPEIYEARLDLNYRMTYARLPGDILQLRVVSPHDETLQNP